MSSERLNALSEALASLYGSPVLVAPFERGFDFFADRAHSAEQNWTRIVLSPRVEILETTYDGTVDFCDVLAGQGQAYEVARVHGVKVPDSYHFAPRNSACPSFFVLEEVPDDGTWSDATCTQLGQNVAGLHSVADETTSNMLLWSQQIASRIGQRLTAARKYGPFEAIRSFRCHSKRTQEDADPPDTAPLTHGHSTVKPTRRQQHSVIDHRFRQHYLRRSDPREVRIPQPTVQIIGGTTERDGPLQVRVSLTDPETGAPSGGYVTLSAATGPAETRLVAGSAVFLISGLKAGPQNVTVRAANPEYSTIVAFGSANFEILPRAVTTTSAPTTTKPSTTTTVPLRAVVLTLLATAPLIASPSGPYQGPWGRYLNVRPQGEVGVGHRAVKGILKCSAEEPPLQSLSTMAPPTL